MKCNHPNPDLCELLGTHIAGRLWEIWTGAFSSNPLPLERCDAYRQKLCNRAGVNLEDALTLETPKVKSRGLGDVIAGALKLIGVTPERVTRWLGRPCGCNERREKLNRLTRWARRIIRGKAKDAEKHLNDMTGEE